MMECLKMCEISEKIVNYINTMENWRVEFITRGQILVAVKCDVTAIEVGARKCRGAENMFLVFFFANNCLFESG